MVPECVLIALAEVRATGLVNMCSRIEVIERIDYTRYNALGWLRDNPNRYMEAVTAMGEQRTE